MLSSRLPFRRCIWSNLSRRLCDKASKTPVEDLKEKRDVKKKEASKKLASLLETLNVEAQNIDKSNNKIILNLAKPALKNKKLLKKLKPPAELEAEKLIEEANRKNVEAIEPELVSAARSVAKDFGGDAQRIESELMEKLRTHAKETVESRARKQVLPAERRARISERLFEGMKFGSETPTVSLPRLKKKPPRGSQRAAETKIEEDGIEPEPIVDRPESKLLQTMRAHMNSGDQLQDGAKSEANLGELFVGVKIDRTKEPERQPRGDRMFPDGKTYAYRREPGSSQFGDFSKDLPRQDGPVKHGDGERVNLFGGTPLNIFKLEDEKMSSDAAGPVLETWYRLQAHELSLLVDHPHKNAYEELIEWTEQGKFWKFPIDNEQGLEEEMKIGFEDHIFLEPLLEGFPEKGPVRHFMELVTVGLSKNPYITVQRKRNHIDWFRQYFKEKEDILKETGAI